MSLIRPRLKSSAAARNLLPSAKEVRMISVRKAEDRGTSRISWLDSHHTFSFSRLPRSRAHGLSLAARDQRRHRRAGGRLRHAWSSRYGDHHVRARRRARASDSLGTGSVIRPGDVQKMSAGTGIRHSEFNHSQYGARALPADLDRAGSRRALQPGVSSSSTSARSEAGQACCWSASNEKRDGLDPHPAGREAVCDRARSAEQRVEHTLAPGRHAWVHVARGSVIVNGQTLKAGDGAAITRVEDRDRRSPAGEVLLFDLG